VSRRELQYG